MIPAQQSFYKITTAQTLVGIFIVVTAVSSSIKYIGIKFTNKYLLIFHHNKKSHVFARTTYWHQGAQARCALATLHNSCRFQLFHLAVSSIMPGASITVICFIQFPDHTIHRLEPFVLKKKTQHKQIMLVGKQQIRFTR